MPGVIFVNPKSGSELSAEELRELFAGHRVVDCPDGDIAARVDDALAEKPDFTDRETVGGGVLDVRVVLADRPLARTRVVLALLRGLDTSPLIVRDTCAGAELGLAVPTVDVALDGEVERLEAPLRYSVRRGELAVLVPPDAAGDGD
jgi:diacylglycerol kinase family enzyme